MYEDSIQELNNLIGELDSFQREHEMKMKRKESSNKVEAAQSSPMIANGLSDFTSMTQSAPAGKDMHTNFDQVSICSGDPNPMLSSTQSVNSNDLTFSDVSSMHNLSHQSGTDLNGSMNGSIVYGGERPNRNVVHDIQLIQEGMHVPDSYLKEHTEIVVLRRKDSVTDLNSPTSDNGRSNGHGDGSGKKPLERVSSFRCTSFARPDRDSLSIGASRSAPSNGSNANESVIGHRNHVTAHVDGQHSDETEMRSKPQITPRPASLSGLFKSHPFYFPHFEKYRLP